MLSFKIRSTALFIFFLIFIYSLGSPAYAGKNIYIPDDLKQWEEWVSYGNEKYTCPSQYNNSEKPICVWPELLDLDFQTSGGSFKQKVTAIESSWLPLPGDKTTWPLSVETNGTKTAVLEHKGRPSIEIAKGTHTVTGKFIWRKIPQSFPVSTMTGLVSLRVNGKMVNKPFIDSTGRLWIQKKTDIPIKEKDKNIMDVKIYRLIEDSIPLKINSVIRLTVSGERRREKLLPCLPENLPTVSVISPLPLKLSEDGSIQVDVRPGQWDIQIINIVNKPIQKLGPAKASYGEEIWAFKPFPELRLSRIEGVVPVDPSQSTMPENWKKFASYLVKNNDLIKIIESQRGCPEKSPDSLFLSRELWLDFNGKGAIVRDNITGKTGQRTFLAMDKQKYRLGRISSNEKDKLVTLLDDNTTGIEIEKGPVNLTAVSRLKEIKTGKEFPLGWNSKFQKAATLLHLPPGWRLLGVKGGNAPYKTTWIDSWSMLDFFLILVVSFAVTKLWRWWWGLIFLAGLTLICHEIWSPFYIWVVLIVTTALSRITLHSDSKDSHSLRNKYLNAIHYSVVLILCGISLMFASTQIKSAIYPQLEPLKSWQSPSLYTEEARDITMPARPSKTSKGLGIQQRLKKQRSLNDEIVQQIRPKHKKQYTLQQQTVATQTGPGIPTWKWKSVPINLDLVTENHSMTLWLTSPAGNSIFSVIRVLLLIIMVFRFVNIRFPKHLKSKHSGMGAVVLAIGLLISASSSAPSVYADIPTPEILSELEKRLKKPHECYPNCASISEARVILPKGNVKPEKKQFTEIIFSVNAAIKTAIPLPSGNGTWELYDMTINGAPHLAMRRENGAIWTLIPEGVHKIRLRGIAFGQTRFRFLFPLKPAYITIEEKGWDISGLNEKNQANNIIQATRRVTQSNSPEKMNRGKIWKNSKNVLSDFLRIKRSLVIGLEWNVVTRIERFVISEDQQNIVVSIPLLENELVRSELKGLTVKDRMAMVNMAPHVNRLEWRSSIPITPDIRLSVPEDAGWAEIWKLELTSMWHREFEGFPVTYPDFSSGSFWYPWPGESLSLRITKLEPAPGESITVDSVKTDYHIGKGYNRIVLNTRIRTTSGRTHTITSPPDTIIKHIKINGRSFPLSGNPEKISLPLQPGSQNIEIEWNEAEKWQKSWFQRMIIPKIINLPRIDLGREINNIDIYMHLPDKLWLLLTKGPTLGPAVLAWSMAGVVLLAAVLLGRIPISPLTTVQWAILGLGLISLSITEIIFVGCWFIAMELRKNKSPISPVFFNLMQIVLILWTFFVIIAFYKAVSNGLLHIPDMQVAGNNSYSTQLHWTQDHSNGILPKLWVATYPVYIYHIFMLAWALWLAVNMMSWAKLTATALKSDGMWRPVLWQKNKRKLKK